MRYLLDTHVVLWLNAAPDRIPEDVRTELAEVSNDLFVSAISAYEVAIKTRLGKLDGQSLVDAWEPRTRAIGAAGLPISPDHAVFAGRMPWEHRDPFDRLLAAQATLEGLRLVTVDRALTSLPSITTLTW